MDPSLDHALRLGFLGDFQGSVELLERLAELKPRDLEVRYELAMTQLMLGMFDEGCANIRQILAVDPTHERALQQISYCL